MSWPRWLPLRGVSGWPHRIGEGASLDSGSGRRAVCIVGERLPSRVASIFFEVNIDGDWRLEEDASLDHQDLDSVSRRYLREQVGRTLERFSVLDACAAQDAANAAICRPMCPLPGLVVRGTVHVIAGNRSQALARDHLGIEQRNDLKREEARRHLAFMQQILSDSDLCRVWWIDTYPDRVADLKDVVGQMKDLKSPHSVSHDALRNEVVRFVDQLLNDVRTPQQREVFLVALARTMEVLGNRDLREIASNWLLSNQDSRFSGNGNSDRSQPS